MVADLDQMETFAGFDSSLPLDADGIDQALVSICSMPRDELCEHLHTYPATFPLDFTDEFLQEQSIDCLRHLLARLVMVCRVAPQFLVNA